MSFFQDIDENISLHWYRTVKMSTFGEEYMFNLNGFYATRLKFKARTGCLGINENLERWGISDSKCDMCKGAKEDLVHFLFLYPTLNVLRKQYFTEL